MQKIIRFAKRVTIVLTCALAGVQLATAVIDLAPRLAHVLA